jgi:hypothetical protein
MSDSVKNRLHRALAEEGGQALPEFLLVLPAVLALLFGIIEFGLALNATNDQTHIANEVARYASVNQNPGGSESLQAWAKKQADEAGEKAGTICISFPSGSTVGNPVKVEFRSTKEWLAALTTPLGARRLATSTLVGTAIMRLEAPPTAYKEGCA